MFQLIFYLNLLSDIDSEIVKANTDDGLFKLYFLHKHMFW